MGPSVMNRAFAVVVYKPANSLFEKANYEML